MDDVIETLMRACGQLGIRPVRPFTDVFDFQAYVLEQFHPASEQHKERTLEIILLAVRNAEAHRTAAVVECLKQVRTFSIHAMG